jgi:hypothetical protein
MQWLTVATRMLRDMEMRHWLEQAEALLAARSR